MKKIKLLFTILTGVAGIIVSGCSSTKVYSDYVEGINYNQFKTFAWLPSKDTTNGNGSLYKNPIVMQNLRKQINQEMFQRGYEISTEDPDILILLHANFEEVEELVRTPIYSSYSYYYPGFYAGPGYPYYYNYYNTIPNVTGYDIRSVEFTQGTIVVDIIRNETQELIWRGWARTAIDEPDEFKRDMKKTVDEIFDEYPVDED